MSRTKAEHAPKKGAASWRPAKALVAAPIQGQRLRWCNSDPMNVQRKESEGWRVVSKETTGTTEHEHPGDIESGKPLTSVTEYRELVLMSLPEEDAQARTEHFNKKTDAQTAGLKRKLQEDAESGGGKVHGKIVIE